jgi:hypothetical protein
MRGGGSGYCEFAERRLYRGLTLVQLADSAAATLPSLSRRDSMASAFQGSSLPAEPTPFPAFSGCSSYSSMPFSKPDSAPFADMSTYSSSPRFQDVLSAYNAAGPSELSSSYSPGPFAPTSFSNSPAPLPSFPSTYPPSFSPLTPTSYPPSPYGSTSFGPTPFGSSSMPSGLPSPVFTQPPIPPPPTTSATSPGLYDFDRDGYSATNPYRYPGSFSGSYSGWSPYKG